MSENRFIASRYHVPFDSNYIRIFYANMAKMKLFEYINQFTDIQHDPVKYKALIQDIFLPDATITITTKFRHNVKKTHHLLSFLLTCTLDMIENPTVSHLDIICNQFVTETLVNKTIYFSSPQCILTCNYHDGSKMRSFIHFHGVMNFHWKIKSLDIYLDEFKSNLNYKLVEDLLVNQNLGKTLFKLMEEKGNDKEIIDLIRSNFQCFQDVTHMGMNNELIKIFQINDIMTCLTPLKIFQRKYKIASPLEAMKLFIDIYENGIGERRHDSDSTDSISTDSISSDSE